MSGHPAHVGECPVMRWTLVDGKPFLDQPWEWLIVMDDSLSDLIPLSDMKRRPDGMAVEVTLRAENGWAQYRRVGRAHAEQCSVWEYLEGEYAPGQPGPAEAGRGG